MTIFWITLVGMIAGACTAASWVPQVWKTWATKSARDFSWGYLALFTTGVSMWFVYGILRDDLAVIVANAVTFGLLMVMFYVKVRER